MPMTCFTLTRAADAVVYHFAAQGTHGGKPAYRRQDADLWILWDPDWGWVAPGEDGQPAGLPFSTPRPLQEDHPPQGTWVSRKGPKSYVYDLRWG